MKKPSYGNGSLRKQGRPVNMLEEVQGSLSSPLAYFEEKVASGQATLDIAKHCLRVEMQNVTTYKDTNVKSNSIEESRAVSSVLHWLWSSGMEETRNFLHDRAFIDTLMPFMIVQNRQARVWEWVERGIASIKQEGSQPLDQADKILLDSLSNTIHAMLYKRLSHDPDMGPVMLDFLGSWERRGSLGWPYLATVYRKPAYFVISRLSRLESTSHLDPIIYDKFVEACQGWGYTPQPLLAWLALLHPTRPDTGYALNYILQKRSSPPSSRRFIMFCLNTARVLLATGKEFDAAWVIEFVRKNFSHELDPGEARWKSSNERDVEQGSLSALDALAIN